MKLTPASREPYVVTGAAQLEESAVLIEHIAETAELARESRLALPSGRTVEARAASGEDHLTVRSASGEIELEVRMTDRGPVLRFRAADIEMSSAGDVRVECDRFQVRAKSGIDQETTGDLSIAAAGDAAIRAGGRLAVAARSARVEAERGSVEIEANDDVRLLGERIKLNC